MFLMIAFILGFLGGISVIIVILCLYLLLFTEIRRYKDIFYDIIKDNKLDKIDKALLLEPLTEKELEDTENPLTPLLKQIREEEDA